MINVLQTQMKNVYLPKTIALLELTGGYSSNDLIVKKTLEYYWKNFNQEFKAFPIMDTRGDIQRTLALLDKYYKLGYRYFFGFSRSTIVEATLNWFNLHPDAIGISTTSTAPILNVPKQIFRLTPNDNYIIEPILPQLQASSKVYYIYTEGEVAMLNILEILKTELGESKVLSYAVNSSNLTVSNMQFFLSGSSSTDSIVLYLLDREPYIDLYTQGLTFEGQQYDILGIQPPMIPSTASLELENKYNIISFKGIETSPIWRAGYKSLGELDYSIVTLNGLQLINYLVEEISLLNISSHFGILQFDEITKDIIYPCFLVQLYNGITFETLYLLVNDPLLGKYQANLV
jgi:hypothetical protein